MELPAITGLPFDLTISAHNSDSKHISFIKAIQLNVISSDIISPWVCEALYGVHVN